MKNSRILVFADDLKEMERLQPAFAELPQKWEVKYCKSQKEALAQLEAQEYLLVFADTIAGSGAGAQFLHEVWKLHPKTVRFLLGDAVEVDVMLTCVLGAHQFVERPLQTQEVQGYISRVEAINGLVGNKNIQTLVSKMRTFPSRPTLYLEVLKEFRSPSASPKVIGEIVSKDLAISTKLIQIVNSAYYGLAQQVSDPSDAVMLIGMEATSSLILSIDAFAKFDKIKPLYFSTDKVWRHSQAVAQAAKRFARSMTNDPAVANDAYTAGLLHDIGKLALALNFEEQYQGAISVAEKNGIPTSKVEKEVFGASHAEVGAYLISLWGLPLTIVEAVARHHLPANEVVGKFSAATAVHLVNACIDSDQPSAKSISEVTKDYPAELGLDNAASKLSEVLGVAAPPAESAKFLKKPEKEPAPVEEAPQQVVPFPAPAADEARHQFSSRGPLICLAAAACVVIAGAGLYIWGNGKAKPVSDQAGSKAPAVAAVEEEITKAGPQMEANAKAEAESLAGVKLQGIMFKGAESTLLINGAAFRVGDEVAGARIVAVTPREVTLQKGSTQHKLSLH